MKLPRRTRIPALLLLGLLALALVACGGGGNEEDEPTPSGTVPAGPGGSVPTATPFAQVPEPNIVTGGGGSTVGGNGGGAGSGVEYTVAPGDFLSTIAADFGVSVDAIREANDLDGDNIFVGQVLIIPRSGGAAPPASTATPPAATPPPADDDEPADDDDEPTPPSGSSDVHVVESGDTPSGIAAFYGVTLEELEEANGGPLGVLQIGQEIIIP